MRLIKTRYFSQWAEAEGVADSVLWKAILELEQGLFDANLGGNVFKKRIAVKSQGKRSGVRTLIATKFNNTAFYMYGFSKNSKANISKRS